MASARAASAAGAPRVDVKETDKAIEVHAELPGVDEKEVDVQLADGILTIKGEKKQEREEKEKGYYLMERSYQPVDEVGYRPCGSGSILTAIIAVSVSVARVRMAMTSPSAEVRISRCPAVRAMSSRGVPAPTRSRMIRPRL